ncbi:hypothetical protein BKA67DRAFT_579274 [Truncatella angustata]|uniref:Uncharacterized protein n=1 Tax=Truncatella angustata TaxID=152316 RepID=A0A9P8UDQ9_9PEZI|nr:uncharacterized protein BKA67DRAFT_579274 [Truncatella angustata]KAH6648044.1 hypothetical protein BKA67DRAFT_579274 [Truncatella angustata]
MSKTFLDYLTQPNPEPKVHKQGKGYSTATQADYGPDRYDIWEDITWDNLKATFEHILEKPLGKPFVRSAKDIPLEKLDIFEEDSVTQLAVAWNEPVLRHVFEGTYKAICEEIPQEAFRRGIICLEKNTGRGHVKGVNGKNQMPDWCAYQRKPGQGPYFPNIVPGDSKPAGKWKSEWIDSKTHSLRRKAHHVMVQITKYMWEARTRYGFILSEEELVLVRLSAYPREDQFVQTRNEGVKQRGQILGSDRFFQNEDGDGDDDDTDEADGWSNPPSNASYAGDTRKTGLQVEYSCIPWVASGHDVLTMNLALWWLPILAVQENSIKQSGTYTSLGEIIRGTSPVFELEQTERDMQDRFYGEEGHRHKRKVHEEEEGNDDIASPVPPSTDKRRRPSLRSRSSLRVKQGSDKITSPISPTKDRRRHPNRRDRSSTRAHPSVTNLTSQDQLSRSARSSPHIFQQSKKRRGPTTEELEHERPPGDEKYFTSFQSNV